MSASRRGRAETAISAYSSGVWITVISLGVRGHVAGRGYVSELSPVKERGHVAQVRAASGRESRARSKFEVFAPAPQGVPSEDVVDSRRAPAWKMVDGKRDVEACVFGHLIFK